MNQNDRTFGRRVATDPRDNLFSMGLLLGATPATSRMWPLGPVLDQGRTASCVGHAWRSLMNAAPAVVPPRVGPTPFAIYDAAQLVDEWPDTPPAPGTSVRAGAKVLMAQGRITAYHWSRSAAEVAQWIIQRGPVVLGTEWYAGMMRPSPVLGNIRPTGEGLGGHAYLAYGADIRAGWIYIFNSWGRWGAFGRGTARMRLADLDILLAEHGEACAAVALRVQPA